MENPHLKDQERKIWLRHGGIALVALALVFLACAPRKGNDWGLCIFGSGLAVVFMLWMTLRAIAIFRRGIPVSGIVRSHGFGGVLAKQKPMVVEYAVLGDLHTIKLDASVEDYPVGSSMLLLYDDRNPTKAVQADKILEGDALAFAKKSVGLEK